MQQTDPRAQVKQGEGNGQGETNKVNQFGQTKKKRVNGTQGGGRKI
jgi:hypothetical protein